MIFVTVGTCSFDALIEAVDGLRERGDIRDSVVCQIGSGSYLPEHCDYFGSAPTLDAWYERAETVICHGGTGTVHELLSTGKPFVAVANEQLSGNHQAEFLAACEEMFGILWCRRLDDLSAAIGRVHLCRPRLVSCGDLAADLRDYLDGVHRRRAGR